MVITPAASSDATERVASQKAEGGLSSSAGERRVKGIGIVEGWGGDEDEDVNIDSDEKDSDSEGLLAAEEELQLQFAAAGGSSSELPSSAGMRRRTESSADPGVRNEDRASNRGGDETPKKVPWPPTVAEGSGLRVRSGREQSGASDGGLAENGTNFTGPKVLRLGSGSGSNALKVGVRRLDARRFRREFHAKIFETNMRNKTPVPDEGGMEGGFSKEGKKFPKETGMRANICAVDVKREMEKKVLPAQVRKRIPVKQGLATAAKEKTDHGRKSSREERGGQIECMLQCKVKDRMDLSGQPSNKNFNNKRTFKDLQFAQAAERKSSLRDRGELSKQIEDGVKRKSGGQSDSGSLVKSKRAKNNEEAFLFKAPVPDKRATPKRGLENEDTGQVSREARGRKLAVKGVNQRPHQVKGNVRKASDGGDKPLSRLSGDGLKKSDRGAAKELFELNSLNKVFQRRPTRKNEKEKEKGESTESKRSMWELAIMPRSPAVCGEEFKIMRQETQEVPVDSKPTRSTDKAQEGNKAQESAVGSGEFHKDSAKQLHDGEERGVVFQQRPTRSSEKAKVSPDRSCGPVKKKCVAAKAETIDDVITEDLKKGLTSSGVDKHFYSQELAGIVSEMAEEKAGGVAVLEKLNGMRNQSLERSEMENNGRFSQSKEGGHGSNLEAKERTKEQVVVAAEQSNPKKQRLSDCMATDTPSLKDDNIRCSSLKHFNNIWHPKTPFSQSAKLTALRLTGTQRGGNSVSTSDVDAKIAASSVDPLSIEPLRRKFHGEEEEVFEEGEIGSQDSVRKDVVQDKFAESGDFLKEAQRKPSEKLKTSIVEQNEPGQPSKQLLVDWNCAAEDDAGNVSTITLLKGVDAPESEEAHTSESDHCSYSYVGSSAKASGERCEPVADAKGQKPLKAQASSKPTTNEKPPVYFDLGDSFSNCNERHIVQVENQTDEQCVLEDRPTSCQNITGIHQDAVLQSQVVEKTAIVQTLEAQAVYDLTGEDRSDSEDGKVSDYHNSYCEHCRQGGELLCCDGSGCKTTFHLECTDPKLLEVPSGNWYCPTCAHKRLSYGVHEVSKLVESIWDVRVFAQCSGQTMLSSLKAKVVPVNDPTNCHKDQREKGPRLGGNRVMPANNMDGVQGEYIDAVDVTADVEDGVPGGAEATSQPQRIAQISDGEQKIWRQTQQGRWDVDVTLVDKSRKSEGKASHGSTSSTMVLKVAAECGDKEYFVKWKGLSHAHNTWVAESELVKLSPKGLLKFKKKLGEGQAVKWNPDWAEPQRLVDKRVSIPPRRPGGGRGRGFLGMDTQLEWFVKWKGLGYEHCTWESVQSGVISDAKFKVLGVMFDSWCEIARQRNHPQRVEEAEKLREASFKQLESQPDWLQIGQLLPYQLDRLNQLRQRWHHHQNTIIVGEEDQEKPSTILAFLLSLMEEYGVYRPILVVVPLFEIKSWEAEVSEYARQVNTVVYSGGKEARGVIQRFELNTSNRPLKVQVILTSFEAALSDFDYLTKIKWEAVVVDESQQSKMAKTHRTFLKFDAAFRLLFVNELSKYNGEELQQILLLLKLQNSFSTSDIHMRLAGLDETSQLQYLKDQLSEHIVIDSKPDDSSGLVLKECWVGTKMTALQIELYCTTLTKHYNLLLSGRLRTDPDSSSVHDFVTQLRRCCQHPYLVDPTLQGSVKQDLSPQTLIDAGVEASEKWQLIHAMLSLLHVQGHRVLILSQLFFLDDYLRQKYGPDSYELVDSRYSALRKNSAVQRFNAKDSSRFVFLLRTGASGFSLKLKDKDVVIIHDSDLNPANDLVYLQKVLQKGVGVLKAFRLYQRFTVEEGSMAYVHQKKLEPDPKPLSVKILQQLLRWKVQHILKLDGSSTGQNLVLKGKHKADSLNDKASKDLERAKHILQGNFGMDEAAEDLVDDMWAAEGDGEYSKEFWSFLLKDRYAELRDREEQANTGKGLRQRKKVQYSEEALALAPYSVVEEDGRLKRRRPQLPEPASASPPQDRARPPSLQSSTFAPRHVESCQDAEALVGNNSSLRPNPAAKATAWSEPEVVLSDQGSEHVVCGAFPKPVSDQVCEQKALNVAVSSGVSGVKQEERTENAPLNVAQLINVAKPAALGSPSLTTSHVDNGKRLRMEQKQQLFRMEPELSQICEILRVSETVASYSQQLLSHVMNSFRMPREPRELVVMVEVSLCLVAAKHLHQVLEFLPAVSCVGEKMNLPLKEGEFASVYARLEGMCKTCAAAPSVREEIGEAAIFLPKAALGGTFLQSSSAQNESPVGIIPTSWACEHTAVAKGNAHLHAGLETSHQNAVLQTCAVSARESNVALSPQDGMPRTVFDYNAGELEQVKQVADCQMTDFQAKDPTIQGHLDQETAHSRDTEVISVDQHLQMHPMAASLDTLLPPLLQTEEAIRAKLKADKDQLLHSWLAKQKLEVQEFNATCAKERDAHQNLFEKQKSKIVGTSDGVEQRAEMLKQLDDVYASTCKLYDQEAEDRRQVMNSKQRALRDNVHALYVKLLQQVDAGTPPDFQAEAESLGLTFAMQFPPSKLLESGHAHDWHAHQPSSPHLQNAHLISSPQAPHTGGQTSRPSALKVQVHPQPQYQPQPQPKVSPSPSEYHPQSWPQPRSQPQPWPQPQPQLQPKSQPMPQAHPLSQSQHHSLLPVQFLPHLQLQSQPEHLEPPHSSLGTHYQPLIQAMSNQQIFSTRSKPSAPEEQIMVASQNSQPHSHQQSTQAQDTFQPSPHPTHIVGSSHNVLGSESIPAVSSYEVGRTQPVSEQWTVQPSIQHSRVSQIINPPLGLQPRVSGTAHELTNVQPRVSQAVQASPILQSWVPQLVQATASQQLRVSHIHRLPSLQQAAWHPPTLNQTPMPQTRVQLQQQQCSVQEILISSAGISAVAVPVASQSRSNAPLQSVPLAAQALSSHNLLGPDPLAHEENRLKQEQEKVKKMYNEETIQIKAQYDREAAELRRRYEGLLHDRAQTFEQKTKALKENLEKVDRNRHLAEALKMRSYLDQQRVRQVPIQGAEAICGHVQPPHQTVVLGSCNIGRSTVSGSYQGNAPSSSQRSGRRFSCAAGSGPVPLTEGGQNGTSHTSAELGHDPPLSVGGQINMSHEGLWQNTNPSSLSSPAWPRMNHNVPPTGFVSGSPGSLGAANPVPLPTHDISSTGSIPVFESSSHTLLPDVSNLFQGTFESVSGLSQTSPSQFTSMQQRRSWASLQEGTRSSGVLSSTTRVEHIPFHHGDSEPETVLSTPAPPISASSAVSSLTVTEAVVVSVNPVSSPPREVLAYAHLGAGEFVQRRHGDVMTDDFSLDALNDVSFPHPSVNQVSSAVESRIRSGAITESAAGGVASSSYGCNGLVSSELAAIGFNHSPSSPPVICLSDDDD